MKTPQTSTQEARINNSIVFDQDFIQKQKEMLRAPNYSKILIKDVMLSGDTRAIELIKHIIIKDLFSVQDVYSIFVKLVRSDVHLEPLKIIQEKYFSNKIFKFTESTLLHEASLFGSKGIVEYMVNNYKTMINAKNYLGQIPLHYASISGDYDIIKNIIEKSSYTQTNIQDHKKNSFLDYLALYGHHHIISKLSNDSMLNEKINYRDFIKHTNSGSIVNIKSFEKVSTEISKSSLMNSNYLKALYEDNPKDQDIYFQEAAEYAKQVIYALKSWRSTPESSEGQQSSQYYAMTLVLIYESYIDVEILNNKGFSMKESIIVLYKMIKLDLGLMYLYNTIAKKFLYYSDYGNASLYSKLAYDLMMGEYNATDDITKLSILFNRGLSLKYSAPEDALELFNSAEKLDPSDLNTIMEKYKLYMTLGDIKSTLSQSEKIDPKFANLFKIAAYVNTPQKQFLDMVQKYNFKQYEKVFKEVDIKNFAEYEGIFIEVMIRLYECENRTPELIELLKVRMETSFKISSNKSEDFIIKILEVYYRGSLWKEGIDFIRACNKQYSDILTNSKCCILHFLQYIFYQKNDDDLYNDLSAKLKNSNLTLFNKSQEMLCLDAIDNKDYIKALSYINDGCISYSKAPHYKLLVQKLQDEQSQDEFSNESLHLSQEENSKEALREEQSKFLDIEFGESFQDMTPKMIHEYFQHKKQKLSADINHMLHSKSSEVISWAIKNELYSCNFSKNIIPLKGKDNFYVTIDDKILKILDEATKIMCMNALSKGLALTRMGSDGVIYTNKHPIKLKFHKDLELYTKEIYINSEGKYLIKFDCCGNHKELSKLSRGFKLTIHNVESYINSEAEDFYLLEQDLSQCQDSDILDIAGDSDNTDNYDIG